MVTAQSKAAIENLEKARKAYRRKLKNETPAQRKQRIEAIRLGKERAAAARNGVQIIPRDAVPAPMPVVVRRPKQDAERPAVDALAQLIVAVWTEVQRRR